MHHPTPLNPEAREAFLKAQRKLQEKDVEKEQEREKSPARPVTFSNEFIKMHREYACFKCNYITKDLEKFKVHWELHKEGYECPFCDVSTKLKDTLHKHMKTHFGEEKVPASDDESDVDEKPFKCTFCSYSSPYKHNLRAHINRMHKKRKAQDAHKTGPSKKARI